MRKLILFTLLSCPAWSEITKVQEPAVAVLANCAPCTLAFDSNVASGNLIVVTISINYNAAITSAVTSSRVPTYANYGRTDYYGTTDWLETWYGCTTSAGADTVSVAFNHNATYARISLSEWSGIDCSSPLDQSSTNSGNDAAPTATGVTTTQASELVFASVGWYSSLRTLVVDGGGLYSLMNNSGTVRNGVGAEYQIVPATGTYTPAFSLTGGGAYWAVQVLTFKAAGAEAPRRRRVIITDSE